MFWKRIMALAGVAFVAVSWSACVAPPTTPPDQEILLVTMIPSETLLSPAPLPTATSEIEPMPVSPDETWQGIAPQPEDAALPRSKAYVSQADVTVQNGEVWLHLQGHQPTPCHRLRVEVRRQENTLFVHIYTVSDPDVICAQILKPFDVKLRLDVPPGKYAVEIQSP